MSLDTQLRETLRSHADTAITGDLLGGVRRRDRRFRRRRWAMGVLAAAVMSLGVVAASTWLAPGREQTAAAFHLELRPANLQMPFFPYDIGWLPEGAEDPVYSYADDTVRARGSFPDGMFDLSVSDQLLQLPVPGAKETQVAVGKYQGTLRIADSGQQQTLALSWRQDDRWIMVTVLGEVIEQTAVHIGESLRPGRHDIRTPFRLALAPVGLEVASAASDGDHATLCLTDPVKGFRSEALFCLNTYPGGFDATSLDSRYREVKVLGEPAWLILNPPENPTLVFRTDDLDVIVHQGNPRLSESDLLRFAEGVRLAHA